VDDALGPTIALGRDLDVERADLCDPHECGATTSLLAYAPSVLAIRGIGIPAQCCVNVRFRDIGHVFELPPDSGRQPDSPGPEMLPPRGIVRFPRGVPRAARATRKRRPQRAGRPAQGRK
jgi:hypothetical protein